MSDSTEEVVLEKEVKTRAPIFEPLNFQPVISPDIYEAEFAVKNEDIIFHFWPFGYKLAEESKHRLPKFSKIFLKNIETIMIAAFGPHRLEMAEELGGVFVRAIGWGSNQFARDIAIKTCESLHKINGGAV